MDISVGFWETDIIYRMKDVKGKINILSILTICLLLTTLPFLYPLTQINYKQLDMDTLIFTIGNISGSIGLVFLFFNVLIGNRKLIKIFTPNLIGVNKFHKFLGTYGTLFILIHPLIEMYSYGEQLLFIILPDLSTTIQTYISIGKVAFILYLIIFTTSVWYRDKISYRNWLYMHYLSYFMVGLVFIHTTKIGSFYQEYRHIQILISFMELIFVANIIYRIATYFNIGKRKYTVKEIQEYGDTIYTITLTPKNKDITYTPGQYFYIKISKLFGEEHPYSLLEYKDNGDIVFGIRAVGSFSKKIVKLKRDTEIFIEGPYGVFTLEAQNKNPKILIAGGVGITPFYELIKNNSNEKTYLFYCNRKIEQAINIIELEKLLGDRYFNVLSNDKTKGNTILSRRLDKEMLKGNIPEKIFKKANFFICGRPNFIKNLKNTVMECGIKENRIFYEEFSL